MELIPMLILAVAFLAREYTLYKERQEHGELIEKLVHRAAAPQAAAAAHDIERLPESRPSISAPLLTDEDYEGLLNDGR